MKRLRPLTFVLSLAMLPSMTPAGWSGANCPRSFASEADAVDRLSKKSEIVLKARVFRFRNPTLGSRTVLIPLRVFKGATRSEYILSSPVLDEVNTVFDTHVDEPDGSVVVVGLVDKEGAYRRNACFPVFRVE